MSPDSYTFQTVVCAVDFSDHSGNALRYAAGLAQRFGARLLVINIADPLLVSAARSQQQTDLIGETRTDLKRFVESILPGAASWSPPPEIIVGSGESPREILELAHRERADLLVMGSHGLSGYRKLIFGSTTQRVLQDADLPVLVVPPPVESK